MTDSEVTLSTPERDDASGSQLETLEYSDAAAEPKEDNVRLTPRKFSLQEAFGPQFPDTQFLMGFERPDPTECPFVPQPNPNWRWNRDLLFHMATWWQRRRNLYVFGPHGAGKTGTIAEFCARLNIPFYDKTFYPNLEYPELITQPNLVAGSSLTAYTWLPLAMGVQGFPGIFCANEFDQGDQGTLTALHGVLDCRDLLIATEELQRVKPSAYYRFTATGNTAMAGDQSGLYGGARRINLATQDRFAWKLHVDYLPPDEEEALLESIVPKLNPEVRKKMVEVANEIRKGFMGQSTAVDALPLTMSTRVLVEWAKATYDMRGAQRKGKSPLWMGLKVTFLNSAFDQPAAHAALVKVIEGKLGAEAMEEAA